MDARYWVVMPAAGAGLRMGLPTPKQYLRLLDKTVIEWALYPFLNDARCQAVMVVLAADDLHFASLAVAAQSRVRSVPGGAERADSVRAGLRALANELKPEDWVLVHDAARPCLHGNDIDHLIATLNADAHAAGGILATPLADTLKRAEGDRITDTVSRVGLWRALTPQMFRYELLQRALVRAFDQGLHVTDEAAALEALGVQPRLVAGRTDNLKITLPEDLALAASILTTRGQR